ncbi:hypothetical protein [Lactococcus sp.]|uniref:hypothetical protein n=1 Tax=Lactococcus sp. TaxID=44273 RepID=UPI0035B09EC8
MNTDLKALPEQEEEKKKKKKWLILILILLLIFGVGGTYIYRQNSRSPTIAGDFLPDKKDAKKMTDKELAKYAQTAADASNFQMLIDTQSNISFDSQAGYLGIKNPTSNLYPIDVDLYQGTEKIYSSGAIEPGEEISSIKLDQKLSKGSYKIKANFNIYDNKTHEKRGQQSAIITMTVT